MRITLRQLQIFTAIAHSGSTTAAASQIALSQSAVSAAIAELERILDLRLFDRVGKRLLLNDHGRALLPRALALLKGADSLEQSFAHDAPSLLVLGASLTIGNYLLPKLLAQYWRKLGVDLDQGTPPLQIMVANTAEVASRVANFEVDIGLVEGPCHRPDIAVTPWRLDELLLVAAPTHALAREYGSASISTSRLAQVNWLLREPGSGTREALEQAVLPHIAQLRSSLEFSDHEAIKQAAIQGLGVGCLSRVVVADALASGQLVELRTSLGKLSRRFNILLQRQRQLTPGMQQFLRHIRDEEISAD